MNKAKKYFESVIKHESKEQPIATLNYKVKINEMSTLQKELRTMSLKEYNIYHIWKHTEGHTVKDKQNKKPIKAFSELHAVLKHKVYSKRKNSKYIKYYPDGFRLGTLAKESNILAVEVSEDNNSNRYI